MFVMAPEGALGKQGKQQGAWADMITCSDALTGNRTKSSVVRKMVKEKREKAFLADRPDAMIETNGRCDRVIVLCSQSG